MSEDYLRRYTDLTALMYLLHKRKITLLDPASWDDKNDSHYLAQYKEKRKLKSVLALCLMQLEDATITGACSRQALAACASSSSVTSFWLQSASTHTFTCIP